MNPQQQSELEALCKKISAETDREKFLALVMELNRLLETEERRLESPAKPPVGQA